MKNFLFNALQKALNYYVGLDTESAQRLQQIKNKYIKIELAGLDIVLHLFFSENGIEFIDEPSSLVTPDATITGTPLSLLRMGLTRGDRKNFFSDGVQIEGDLELAQSIVNIFDQLEIDWEEILAQRIGDAPAYHLGKIANTFKNWVVNTKEALRQDTVDYIHEEKLWFPQRELLQEFFAEVDALRMDVERLEMKIKHLGSYRTI